jgi:hypothetical protein
LSKKTRLSNAVFVSLKFAHEGGRQCKQLVVDL